MTGLRAAEVPRSTQAPGTGAGQQDEQDGKARTISLAAGSRLLNEGLIYHHPVVVVEVVKGGGGGGGRKGGGGRGHVPVPRSVPSLSRPRGVPPEVVVISQT